MKKIYKIEVDCANCANKMELAARKTSGVAEASVNFMMQKLTVEAPDDQFDKIMDEVVKVCKKIEPDCTIVM